MPFPCTGAYSLLRHDLFAEEGGLDSPKQVTVRVGKGRNPRRGAEAVSRGGTGDIPQGILHGSLGYPHVKGSALKREKIYFTSQLGSLASQGCACLLRRSSGAYSEPIK